MEYRKDEYIKYLSCTDEFRVFNRPAGVCAFYLLQQ